MRGTSHLKFEEMPELKRFGRHPFKQIEKKSSWSDATVFPVLYIVLKRSLLDAFKGQYLVETQVAEELPDISVYLSCQSLDVSFCLS